MSEATRKSFRLHIGIFGRRNCGKSSLLNAVLRQAVSIVSEQAGTTTDPVEKPMELQPLGPVLFIDTAGIDDSGALGELRVAKTRQVFERTDLGIVVAESGNWGEFEEHLIAELENWEIPVVVVFNKSDLVETAEELLSQVKARGLRAVKTVAIKGEGIEDLCQAMVESVPPERLIEPDLLGDLVAPGECVVMVVPIDKEAPKGRLITPQVQAIRNVLDADAYTVVAKERELRFALENLRRPPCLVVTDSQAFLKVAADVSPETPFTSFSILFARLQGDLVEMVKGALAIDALQAQDRILVAEACSHHPIADDIGRVKLPRWLRQYVGSKLEFEHVQGHDFPEDLSSYRLVIHCGACMWNRREMISRIARCKRAGVPITNYGLSIAYSLGIFERALRPFPAALEAYHAGKV